MSGSVTARGCGPPPGGLLPILGIAEFMLVLDLSVVNVALPAIGVGLGMPAGTLEWVINAYALGFGGFLLLGGRASDLFGGRRVFLAALSAFSLASLACGLASGPAVLIAARSVQGLSAGMLSPTTLSILTLTFTEARARNRALSVWTTVAIGGGSVGAVIGGLLTGLASWRWIFFVNVPVGAILLVSAALRLPRTTRPAAASSLDVAGAVTVTGGLAAVTWALASSRSSGWASPQVTGTLLGALALFGLFAVAETRAGSAPLVPFSAFRSRQLSAGNALNFLSFVPVMATWFFLTLFLQDVRGFTALQAGLIFLPVSVAVAAGAQASFKVIAMADARVLFLAGGGTAAAGLAWLAQLTPSAALWAVILPACLTMAGGGLMFAPITTAATSGAPPGQAGLASGLLNTSRQVGGSVGLATLATIAGAHHGGSPASLTAGFRAAFGVGTAIFAVTAITGALILPRILGRPAP